MTLRPRDTIAAVATPPGRGGVGIVRVSGDRAAALAAAVLGQTPAPRRATFARFLDADGEVIDEGLALLFKAPASFTGEDVLELHAHGSPVVLDMLMARLVALGARPADPGEFSRRAFSNGKRDLAQLEAVADLIASRAEQAARNAQRVLQGELSQLVEAFQTALGGLRAQVEAALDFAGEDLDLPADLAPALDALGARLDALLRRGREGALLQDGATVALVGRPNVGKSSLLNRLAMREEAIVTPVAGTTRDVVKCDLVLRGLPLRLLDTAGLRETTDPVEVEGVRRSRRALEDSDLVLLVLDETGAGEAERELARELDARGAPWLAAANKCDLAPPPTAPFPAMPVSAKTGQGLDALVARLREQLGAGDGGEDALGARRRHLAALARARDAVTAARRRIDEEQIELAAEELRLAQNALDEIVGQTTNEALLGEIFSSFCIGK